MSDNPNVYTLSLNANCGDRIEMKDGPWIIKMPQRVTVFYDKDWNPIKVEETKDE